MNSKWVISLVAVSALAMGGCSQQKKPPAGPGQVGLIGDGSGAGSTQSGGASGGSAGGGTGGAGQGGAGAGSGGGSGSAGGMNQGSNAGSGGYSQNGALGGVATQGGGLGANQGGGFGSGTYSGNTKGAYTPADLRDPRSILARRVIYFDYDQSSIRPEYRKVLDAHGSLLADFPRLNVRLEGHADERGSREYNVALSERRAYSVLDYLKIKGVSNSQADIVGYGEEVPAQFGHGEGSWSKNRRVEIIYAGE